MRIGQLQTKQMPNGKRVSGELVLNDILQIEPINIKVEGRFGKTDGVLKFTGPVTSSRIRGKMAGQSFIPSEVLTYRHDKAMGEVIIGETGVFNLPDGGIILSSQCLKTNSDRNSTDLGLAITKVAMDHLSWFNLMKNQIETENAI